MKDKVFRVLLVVACCSFANGCNNGPTIVKRNQWAGAEPRAVNYLIVPIPYVIIQHTVTPECSTSNSCSQRVENIRSFHMDNLNFDDIGYSFIIGGDGKVYEGVGWNREGAHTYGYNKKAVGIAFIGNFQNKAASNAMIQAAHKLILCGKNDGILRPDVKVVAARQVQSTVSPGLELYRQIQNWPEWSSTV